MFKCLTQSQEPLFIKKNILTKHLLCVRYFRCREYSSHQIDTNPFPYGVHSLVMKQMDNRPNKYLGPLVVNPTGLADAESRRGRISLIRICRVQRRGRGLLYRARPAAEPCRTRAGTGPAWAVSPWTPSSESQAPVRAWRRAWKSRMRSPQGP